MSKNLAIKINKLFKSYDDVKAVQGIDLEINKGEFYGLLGPNGAGKSTAMKAMLGLLTLKERIEYLLEKLGLSKHRTKKMRELSGGMKRRLQIAKALVHDPEIIILDEPTAGVDVELRHDLWLYLQELHKDGKTILLTTHYIDEAELLCERVGIIDKGKLIVEDTVSNLKKMVKNSSIEIQLKDNDNNDLSFLSEYDYKIDNNSLKIFTDTPNLELPSIILKFSEKDIKIEDIHIPQTSLEDVFLDLTGRKIND